ncbi:MAG: large-conductance mechanosensitive channel protein MscL [Chloroflexota bacterium]
MIKEFREFVMRGNVLDLAVGIIIGVAFGAVVSSLVKDIIMPPIGYALGGLDFSNMFISLNGTAYPSLALAQEAGAPTINYGLFIAAIINFLIVALAVFLLVKAVNSMMERMKKKEEVAAAVAGPTTEERLIEAMEKLTKVMEEKA